MLGDSGWEAQRPFKTPGKTGLKRMPGMLRNPSLVCQRQQEADMREGGPAVSYVFKINGPQKVCHSSQTTCALRMVIASERNDGGNTLA